MESGRALRAGADFARGVVCPRGCYHGGKRTRKAEFVNTSATSSNVARPPARRGSEAPLIALLTLVALTVASRLVGLAGGFVFDDYVTFHDRAAAPLASLPRLFWTNQLAGFGSNFYRPVLLLWYELWFRLLGPRPLAWHALGLLLHLVCVLLFYALAQRLLARRSLAWVAAALFAVHPALVEVVAWASAMGDALMTAFLLLSALAFRRWFDGGRPIFWFASLLAAEACFASKETGVVLPVILLATALFDASTKSIRRILLAWTPFCALLAVHLVVRNHVLSAFAHPFASSANTSLLGTWPAALWFYLQHLFWPSAVVPFYPLHMADSWQQGWELGALLVVLAALLGGLLWRAAGWRRALLCAVWLLAPLAPVLYLRAFPDFELVHDRFLYAPLLGFAMAAALVLRWAADRVRPYTEVRVFPLAVAAILALWGLRTVSETFWWQSDLTLFTHAVAVTPDNPRALVNLANAYVQTRRCPAAVPYLRRALAADARCDVAWFLLGITAYDAGDDRQAVGDFVQALRLKQDYERWRYLAKASLRLGQSDVAETAARQALALDPQGEGVHATLADVLLVRGARAAALQQYRQELQLHPTNAEAVHGLALARP